MSQPLWRAISGAGDLQALPVLQGADEGGGLGQAVVAARVQPGLAAGQAAHVEAAALEIDAVHVGDLQLAARGGAHAAGDLYHVPVVEVEAGDRPV